MLSRKVADSLLQGRGFELLSPAHAAFALHGLSQLSEVKGRRIGELLLR
jgi:hypothetical protein